MASTQAPSGALWPTATWPVQVLIVIVRWKVQSAGSGVPVTAAAARAPVAIMPQVAASTMTPMRVAIRAADHAAAEGKRRLR